MTTQELIEDIEKRNLEAQRTLGAALAVGAPADPDLHSPAQVNPVVQDALDSYEPSPEPSVTDKGDGSYDVKLGGALKGVTLPFTPGVAEEKNEDDASDPFSFYNLLLQNENVRKKAAEAYDRNEKANRARTRIAAVADALSSLGNLIGTTQGAFNQEQTYQAPLVSARREQDLTYARKLATSLNENDMSLRLAKLKLDASGSNLDRQLAIQDKMTERAMLLAQEREKLKGIGHDYKTEEIAQQGDIRKDVARMNNESAERRANISAGASRANKQDDITFKEKELEAKKNGEIGSGGGVNGYETTTVINRDRLGNELGRTTRRVPTGPNGAAPAESAATTRRTPPKGEHPVEGTDRTPPSRRKKDESRTPPSRRR